MPGEVHAELVIPDDLLPTRFVRVTGTAAGALATGSTGPLADGRSGSTATGHTGSVADGQTGGVQS